MKHILLSFVLVLTFSFSAFADECVSGDCVNGYGTYVWDMVKSMLVNVKMVNDAWTRHLYLCQWDKYVGEYKNDNAWTRDCTLMPMVKVCG